MTPVKFAGVIHGYLRQTTLIGDTRVIGVFGEAIIEIECPPRFAFPPPACAIPHCRNRGRPS